MTEVAMGISADGLAAFQAAASERLDASFKGISPSLFGRTMEGVVGQRLSLFGGDFLPPIMTLRAAALENNLAAMASYAAAVGVELMPHGKTTLAPALFRRQLEAGATGISVATPSQVILCRRFGIEHVFLANEVVDASAIDWLLDEHDRDPDFELLAYVDSVEGVGFFADALRRRAGDGAAPRGLSLLVEVGIPGGRTGCRTTEQAVAVARAAAEAGMSVLGVAGYEGGLGHEIVPDVLAAVREFLGRMRAAAEALLAHGLLREGSRPILTAGGSVFFDEVVAGLQPPLAGGLSPRVIIRPGAYVSHDHGHYAGLSPFTRPGADGAWSLQPALEAWGQLVSVPEPGLALADIGRRDVSFDLGLPVPLRLRRPATGMLLAATGATVMNLNDQHAFVALPEGIDARPGDWISFGISHPCTAFDKWHLLPVVDDELRVVDLIRTYF